MIKIKRLLIAAVAIICVAIVLLLLWPKAEPVDPFEIMEHAAGIRMERKVGQEVYSCESYKYELMLQSGFTKLRMEPVDKQVDAEQWQYRITYNFDLEDEDPQRIEFLIGDQWVQIEDTVYQFESTALWEGFESTLERTFAEFMDKDELDE